MLKHAISICNIYIAPNENVRYADLYNLIDQLPPPFLIVGDFNGHNPMWGSTISNNVGQIVEDILMSTDSSLLNTGEETHEHLQTGSSSCIDLCILSSALQASYEWQREDELFGSDHYPIIVKEIDNLIPIDLPKRFLYKKADWSLFSALTDRNYDELMNYPLEDKISSFTEIVLEAAKTSIPISSSTRRVRPLPWWNDACRESHRNRKACLRRYKRTKAVEDKIELNRTTALARKIQRRARKENWMNFISTINKDTPMSKIWKRVKKLNGKYIPSHPPSLHDNGVLMQDPQVVADILGEHLASVSSNNSYDQSFIPLKNRIEAINLNFNSPQEEQYNDPITAEETQSCLTSLKNSASGPDEISNEILKHLHIKAMQFLVHIFNSVWLQDQFPLAWRTATVLAFPKPGKDPKFPSSYRPIALTCSMCKLLENIVNRRLMHELERNGNLSPYQYGFRKMRNCSDSLARLETEIREAFARKKHLIAVFFDMTKAYDKTWRYHILHQLHSLGYRGHLSYFIQNFLRDRKFKVRIKNVLSHEYEQQQGVPQGSVISCTLFALAIDGIVEGLPADVRKSLYVDDLAIYYASNNLNTIQRKLQLSINHIAKWTTRHGFQISTEKTIAVHFHNRRNIQNEIILQLNNQNILFKDEVKFLGLVFDRKLCWKAHVNYLKNKCVKSLSLMKCLSNMSWGADKQSLLRIYRATTRSILDYASPIYGSAKPYVLKKLNSVHNSALRICTGAFKSSPIPSLLVDAGELSLDRRRTKLGLQHYLRLFALPGSPAYNVVCDESRDHLFADARTVAPFGVRMRRALAFFSLNSVDVLPSPPLQIPKWRMGDFICQELFSVKKSTYSSDQLKQIFNHHITLEHPDCYQIFTDGSSDEGSGCGVCSVDLSKSVKISSFASSFTAELYAILEALTFIQQTNHPSITVFSDSRSSLQILLNNRRNNPIANDIITLLYNLKTTGRVIKFCWVPAHSNIQGNETADRLAKEAATSQTDITHSHIPHRDYYRVIREKIYEDWQLEWSNTPTTNKLRSIRPSVSTWHSSTQNVRRNEVLLSRLRIGHTRLTHGFLMSAGQPIPYCMDCLVPQTVRHFLEECPEYSEARTRLYGATVTLSDILSETNNDFNMRSLLELLRVCDSISEI